MKAVTTLSRGQQEYRNYLNSPTWHQVRRDALARAKCVCSICHKPGYDVHHKVYRGRGKERPGDLQVLCRKCHDWIHSVTPKITAKTAGDPGQKRKQVDEVRLLPRSEMTAFLVSKGYRRDYLDGMKAKKLRQLMLRFDGPRDHIRIDRKVGNTTRKGLLQ